MGEPQTDLHNRLAGEIVKSIVRPIVAADGTSTEILVLLESVVVGVVYFVTKMGGDEKVLDVMVDGARQRLAEIRLGRVTPAGSA